MTQNTEPTENNPSTPEAMVKGKPVTLFPIPRGEETKINQLRRLADNGKNIGIFRATADKKKAGQVINHPLNSWAVMAEAAVDMEDFDLESRPVLDIPGQAFTTLLAQKPDGSYFICFADRIIKTEDPEAKVRHLEFVLWYPRTSQEIENLGRRRKTTEPRSRGNPLTLTKEELSTTIFKFI